MTFEAMIALARDSVITYFRELNIFCHFRVMPQTVKKYYHPKKPWNSGVFHNLIHKFLGKWWFTNKNSINKPSETLAGRFRELAVLFSSIGYLTITDTAMLLSSMLTILPRTFIRFGNFISSDISSNYTAMHDKHDGKTYYRTLN